MHSVFSKSLFMYMYSATKYFSEGVLVNKHSNKVDLIWKLVFVNDKSTVVCELFLKC